MSKVSIQGDASGTGTLTIAAPNTNSNYTLTLPEATGTMLTSAGGQTITKSADTVQTLNRTTSDGTIAEFQKDGSAVGSIGTYLSYPTIGKDDTGVLFDNTYDTIVPWNLSTNGTRDASTDLGASGNRFKDLYLSGGVYLGGTGAANYLDDYEEGTWTPTLAFGGSSAGFAFSTSPSGKYTKIGNLVYLQFGFRCSTKGTGSGAFSISGAPFTSVTYGSYKEPVGTSTYHQLSVTNRVGFGPFVSGTTIQFYGQTLSGDESALVSGDFTNTTFIRGMVIYQIS
jgi:hypothetical protein